MDRHPPQWKRRRLNLVVLRAVWVERAALHRALTAFYPPIGPEVIFPQCCGVLTEVRLMWSTEGERSGRDVRSYPWLQCAKGTRV